MVNDEGGDGEGMIQKSLRRRRVSESGSGRVKYKNGTTTRKGEKRLVVQLLVHFFFGTRDGGNKED